MKVKVTLTETIRYSKTYDMPQEEFGGFMGDSEYYESSMDYGMGISDIIEGGVDDIEIFTQHETDEWKKIYPHPRTEDRNDESV